MSAQVDIVAEVHQLLDRRPDVGAVLDLKGPFDDFSAFAGALFQSICGRAVGGLVAQTYARSPDVIDVSIRDITQTALRNFEPGGVATTVLFSRGVQAMMGHRVAHQLWTGGDHDMALALKAAFGRAFATDIHPAARIGAGMWLDHGVGFVVGETAVIGKDVSIWHNVTLGSTLTDSGPNRHPRVGDGAVIGAGAILLGDIVIGVGANIAAGAIVVSDVPAHTTVVGAKARTVGVAKVSFAPTRKGYS